MYFVIYEDRQNRPKNVKPKKSYGQHFLAHEATAQRIAALIADHPTRPVLEVGPGKGALTRHLVHLPHPLKVIEADRDMIRHLQEQTEFPLDPEQLIQGDILKIDFREVFDNAEFTLIGNFPYNISSQILIKLLESREWVPEMIGMFQKEVADRIRSKSGSKTYGTLSVITQVYYEVEQCIKLSPGQFFPPPKVQSAVIRCSRRHQPLFSGNFQSLRIIVRAIFGKRRKMLRNSLKALFDKEDLSNLPYLDLRPEQLDLQQFIEIATAYEQTKSRA